uniref:Uncharacterized protein n=1 Tax=Leersia perrieri TaxID=77586 RepID=A0A0D9XCC8_9ORYZ
MTNPSSPPKIAVDLCRLLCCCSMVLTSPRRHRIPLAPSSSELKLGRGAQERKNIPSESPGLVWVDYLHIPSSFAT